MLITERFIYLCIYLKSDFQGDDVFEFSEEQAFNRIVVDCLVSITDFPRSERITATGSVQWCQEMVLLQ